MFKKFRFNFFTIILSFIVVVWLGKNVFAKLPSEATQDFKNPIHHQEIIAQTDFSKVEIKTILVRDNIYMLEGDGGNIGVAVSDESVVMIDSQFAPLTDKITTAIKKITDQPIKFLINTHYHFDHTNGNENIRNLGATIIAHDNVPKQMSIAHKYSVLAMDIPAANPKALPMITFDKDTHLSLNNTKIHAFNVPPAHTDGDIVVHFPKQNVIHTGDLFFNGIYPFIDTEVGGSVEGMIKGINQILPLCNEQTLLIPGHGSLSNKAELMAFRDMLQTVNDRVKLAIATNIKLEDLIKTKPLKDLEAKNWNKGFLNSDQMLTLAYNGLMKK